MKVSCQLRLKIPHSSDRKFPHPGMVHFRPTGGARVVKVLIVGSLSFITVNRENGPEQSRARWFCAAQRTLDGEDRSVRSLAKEREPVAYCPRPAGETDQLCA